MVRLPAKRRPWIRPSGITRQRLAERLGASKQAVQQCAETLERQSSITRHPDPKGSRARRVLLTPAGIAIGTRANEVKIAISADYRDLLGELALRALKSALARLNASSRTP